MAAVIDPTKDRFAQYRADDRPGAIRMLNLARFRAQAAFPDGWIATGAEAQALRLRSASHGTRLAMMMARKRHHCGDHEFVIDSAGTMREVKIG